MDSFVSLQELFTTVLDYLAAGATFDAVNPDGQLWVIVESQGAIDSYLCLRCASIRMCRIVTGPPLLEALEFAIRHGDDADDCQRYQSILDSGWLNQVYPNVSLATVAIGDVYCHPVLYGDVLFNRGFIPLGMQRSFFIQYCFSGNSGSPARWEIRFGNGVARSYELVFGKFTGHASRHFARWHPPEWYLFLSL